MMAIKRKRQVPLSDLPQIVHLRRGTSVLLLADASGRVRHPANQVFA
jgi:hypothetical protein